MICGLGVALTEGHLQTLMEIILWGFEKLWGIVFFCWYVCLILFLFLLHLYILSHIFISDGYPGLLLFNPSLNPRLQIWQLDHF
jgi:hypothetical protein